MSSSIVSSSEAASRRIFGPRYRTPVANRRGSATPTSRCMTISSGTNHGLRNASATANATVVTMAMTTGEMVCAKKISSSSTSVVIRAIRSPLPRPSSLAGARRRMAANAFDRNSASSLNATLWFIYCSAYRISPRMTAHTAIAANPTVMLTPHTGSSSVANRAITPNTGRKVAARWPSVPNAQAAIIVGRSGPTSCSRRRISAPVPSAASALPDVTPDGDGAGSASPHGCSKAEPVTDSDAGVPITPTGPISADATDAPAMDRCPTCSMTCCARNRSAYTPPRAISAACVPVSATRPWSNTTTWSAVTAFAMRCVIMITVADCASSRIVSRITASLSASTLLVASSKT